MIVTLDTELIRQFLLAHAETILTWLVAGLLMMLLARFELRRAVRKSALAMSETVATTVAACVPDVAHAAARSAGAAAHEAPVHDVESQRADALRRLSLDTVATVMARSRWLEDIGNLRLPDEALQAGHRAGGADPLLVVAPQRVAQAYLAAQRVLEDAAADLQLRRRAAQHQQDALHALEREAQQIEKETGSIVMRFEQANAQPAQVEGGDYQRFLIQKYNALGVREKEIAQERQHMQLDVRASSDALVVAAHAAAQRYTQALAPLMEQLRAAWGHGDSPEVFNTWLRTAADAPAPESAGASARPAVNWDEHWAEDRDKRRTEKAGTDAGADHHAG
jgi:hypothetical protein